MTQAHVYYSQEDYKDDSFAKGKAFGRFIKASDLYGAEVEKETNVLSAAQLVELKSPRDATLLTTVWR